MVFATGEWCLVFWVNSAGWACVFSVYLLVMAVGGRHCDGGGLCSQVRFTCLL